MVLIEDETDLINCLKEKHFFRKKICLDDEILLTKKITLNSIKLVGLNETAGFKCTANGMLKLGNNNIVKNLKIHHAKGNAILIKGGSNNKIIDVFTSYNEDTGIQLCEKASNNKIIRCISAFNNNDRNSADGFACKLKSGKNNIFKKCVSFSNGDDGFDTFEASHGVKFYDCTAFSNGFGSNGSGFKLGGFKNKTNLEKDIVHILKRCFSIANCLYGFTANNQVGEIRLSNCSAIGNNRDIFFPETSHPKSMEFDELKLGKTYIYKCQYEKKK